MGDMINGVCVSSILSIGCVMILAGYIRNHLAWGICIMIYVQGYS